MCMTTYLKKNIKEIGLVDVQVEELEIWDEGIGAVGTISVLWNQLLYRYTVYLEISLL